MQKIQTKTSNLTAAVLLSLTIVPAVLANEKIIQQESISFEKCLKVITTSQNKLSIAPDIKDISDKKRVAVFKLVDGTLTISCDALEGNITVSTNTN